MYGNKLSEPSSLAKREGKKYSKQVNALRMQCCWTLHTSENQHSTLLGVYLEAQVHSLKAPASTCPSRVTGRPVLFRETLNHLLNFNENLMLIQRLFPRRNKEKLFHTQIYLSVFLFAKFALQT